jgi:hypothetical protein
MMRRWVLPLLLVALAAAFFWRLWLAPDGFLYRSNSLYSDLTITHWPNALFIRDSLATWRQVPLWRPLILGGQPFAANPLSGLWYPPNLLLLVLPLTPTFNLLFVLHTAWVGWGGYKLARATEASRAGGLLAAFTLMLAPKALVHLATGHVGLYCAWAWLPWTLWAARRLAARGRPGDVATAAVTAAMLVLADVRLGFYGGLAAAAYWLLIVSRGLGIGDGEPETGDWRLREVRGRWLMAGVGAGLLAASLVGAQAASLAAVSGRLNRGALSLEESGIASLPPRYLVGLVVADHAGFQEWMTYLGATGLLLALAGLARWPGKERWWWGGLALAAAVYSLGIHTPLYGLLYRALPPLQWLRGPARAWFLVVLATAVLAARGLTAMAETRVLTTTGFLHRRWMDQVAVGLVGAALAGGGGGLALGLPVNVVAAAIVWPASGALVALRAGGRLRASLFAGLALALALADLWGVGSTLYRVRQADEVLAEGQAAAAWLADQVRPFRIYSPSYSIPQHTGAVYGVEMVDGVDPFQLADYVAFMRAATRVNLPGYSVTIPSFPEIAPREGFLLAHRGVVPDLRLLGLLNVRYVAAAYPMEAEGLVSLGERGGVYLYRNERALPRAFMVRQVETVEGLEEALAWLAENDPAASAVVVGGSGEAQEDKGTPLRLGGQRDGEARRQGLLIENCELRRVEMRGGGGVGEARLVEWTPNYIQVEAEGPGLLVLSEVYDPDWRVRVDGREAEMVRADGILRGTYLEGGRHRVEFAYRPAGLWVGCWMTTAGWVAVAVLWVAGSREVRGSRVTR